MKKDNDNGHHFVALAHGTFPLASREKGVFIELSETIIHTVKNIFGTQNLFLNTTTWTNVHILNGYSKPVSLSAYVHDLPPGVLVSSSLLGSPSLLLLNRVAQALVTCTVRNVVALFLLPFSSASRVLHGVI